MQTSTAVSALLRVASAGLAVQFLHYGSVVDEDEGARLWKALAGADVKDSVIADLIGRDAGTIGRWRNAGRVPLQGDAATKVRTALNTLARRPRTDDLARLTSDLRQTISSASAILERLATLSPDDAVAAVVSRLARSHDHSQIVVRPAYRGRLSRELGEPLHYLLGVDLLNSTGSKDVRPVEETKKFVTEALRNDWHDLGLHLRTGTPPEWPQEPRPAVVLQIPIVERPRTTHSSERLDLPHVGNKIIVVAPVYGYGELIAALLAEALGLDLADLRYQEEPPRPIDLRNGAPDKAQRAAAREAREQRARRLLRHDRRHIAFGVAGGKILEALKPELSRVDADTVLIAVSYGPAWAERGRAVHGTPVGQQISNGASAIALSRDWARTRPAISVRYEDLDVRKPRENPVADGDLIADATVLTAIQILDLWKVDPSDWRPGWLSHVRDAGRLERMSQEIRTRESTVTIEQPS